MSNRSNRWLWAILAAGLLIRLAAAIAYRDVPLTGDAQTYDTIAWNLASGRGYTTAVGNEPLTPTASRGPGYVLILAAIFRLAGHHTLPILLLQAFLDTFCIGLVWSIGRTVFTRPGIALVGALLYAVYPPFILQAASVLSETYVIATLLLAIHFGLQWAVNGRASALPMSAVAIGLCALSKPQLAPVAVLVVFARSFDLRSPAFWRALALQIAIVTAVLAPWIVRNAIAFHRFIPGVTMGGVTFWGATGPADGRTIGGLGEPGVPPHVYKAIQGLSEWEVDRWFYAEGIRVMRAAPGRAVVMMGKKFMRLWFNLFHDRPPSRRTLLLAAFNFVMLGLCIAGIRLQRPQAPAVRLLVWLFALFSLVHVVIAGTARYALPCYAYIFVFSGAGVVALLGDLRLRAGGHAAALRS